MLSPQPSRQEQRCLGGSYSTARRLGAGRAPWQLGQEADLKPSSVTNCRQPWNANTTPRGFDRGTDVTISRSMNTCVPAQAQAKQHSCMAAAQQPRLSAHPILLPKKAWCAHMSALWPHAHQAMHGQQQ